MEVVAKHLQATGFSEEVAAIAAAPRRASTNRLYDGRWRIFTSWAEDNGINPFNPTAPQLARFLHYLCTVKELDPQTVKGYRTTLASVLIPLGVSDAINSPVLSQLLKGLEIAKPRQSLVIPAWDLGIVMNALKSAPFEPLGSAPLKELTYKTVFLLAMASGGRRSELQALMHDDKYCYFAPLGAHVKLSFNPSFIRKNQRASETNAPLLIPAIPTGQAQFGHPNCPVRALKYYHRRTRDPAIRKGRLHMFLPLKDVNPGREISSSTISRWICNTIIEAHNSHSDPLPSGIKAHEVRAVATSLRLFSRTPLNQIIEAGRWHSSCTFSKFYLRDLVSQENSIRSAGKIVAAGQVVSLA
jgi:hypothetical protein